MKKKLTTAATIFILLICCFNLTALSQTRITGKITSQDGEGLAGVNITAEGTERGTLSDKNGMYNIDIPPGTTSLNFSYVGYIASSEIINNRAVINVVLMPKESNLSNVVVVGYGTQRKKDLTGAISSISSKEISKSVANSFEQAIQGKLAGVTITNDAGDPGGGVSVKIRGVGTVNNTEPLYVVDGVPLINNSGSEIPTAGSNGKVSDPLANLNPSDIESIDILKDASAAAIYGVRGANGVVIITTKRGKQGKIKVSLDTYTASETVPEIHLLKARDYADLMIEMYKNAGTPLDSSSGDGPYNLLNPSYVIDRANWQDVFFKRGNIQNYFLNLSGATDKVDYSLSGGYYKNTGTAVGMGLERYSVRINSNYHLGKITIGESISLSRTKNRRQSFISARSPIRVLAEMAPTIPVYDSTHLGGYDGPGDGDGFGRWNPVGLANLTEHYLYRNNIVGSIYADWEIFKGLKYKLNLGGDFELTKGTNFLHSFYFGPGQEQPYPSLMEYNSDIVSPLIENTLTYTKRTGNHDISLLAGYTQQSYDFKRVSAFASALQSNDKKTLNTARADAEISITGIEDAWAIRSFLGRLNYGYKDKYLFTANIRRDGSSRFAPEHRWGTFPSFSAGWRLSQENFMKNIGFISDLKLRAGYGVIGNQEVPPYGFEATLITSANYPFAGTVQGGVTQTSLPNPDLRWELSKQTNIGLDASFLNGKIQFTADYFIKKTENMILAAPIPGSTGVSEAPLVNAGDVLNRGIELSLGYQKAEGVFHYSVNANGTFIKNKVTSLGIGVPIEGRFPDADGAVVTVTEKGYAIGSFIGYVTDGIFQTQEEIDKHATQPGATPGDIRFKDLNNDGVINGKDETILGNPIPEFSYGLSLNADYKGFDISIFGQGIEGVHIYNGVRYWTEGMAEVYNHDVSVLKRWTAPGTSNTMPRAILGDPNFNRRPSDRFLEDGSYLRLKNISLGYTFPSRALNSFGKGVISNIRIYITGQNLLTFTKYSGYDPEIGTGYNQGDGVANQGVDYGIQPQAKTILAGINITF